MRKFFAFLVIFLVLIGVVPLRVNASVPYVVVTGTVDFKKGEAFTSGKLESSAIVLRDGKELLSKNSTTFETSFKLGDTSNFVVALKNGQSISISFTFPEMPSILKRLLPSMNFSFNTGTNELKFWGKLARRPTGSLRGNVSNVEAKLSSNFEVEKDGSFSSSIKLQEGDNTIRSYVRYMLLVKVSLPDIKTKLGNATVIKLRINDPKMYVNGVVKEIDPGRGTVPVIKSSRTLLPIRTIVESLGGTVDWNGTSRKVAINFKDKIIEMWIDNPVAKVNGISKPIDPSNKDVKPIIINGRTMLPIRFVSESLGAYVDWIGDTKEVLIVYSGG